MSTQDITLSSSLRSLEPGMWIFRYASHSAGSVPPLVSLAQSCLGQGTVDFFPGEGISRNTLTKIGDCIIARVKGGSAGVLITEYHAKGQQAQVQIRLDRIDSRPETLAAAQGAPSGFAPAQPMTTGAAHAGVQIKAIGHIERRGDVVANNSWLGDPNGFHRLEGFAIHCEGLPEGVSFGYSARTTGSQPQAVLAGNFVGTRQKAKAINAVAFNLGGPKAAEYQLSGEVVFAGQPPQPLQPGQEMTGPSGNEQLVALRIRIEPRQAASFDSPWDDPAITEIFRSH